MMLVIIFEQNFLFYPINSTSSEIGGVIFFWRPVILNPNFVNLYFKFAGLTGFGNRRLVAVVCDNTLG